MVEYSEPRQPSHVPVVDLAGTFDGPSPARVEAAATLLKACRDTGFFQVVNHGVDPALMEALFAQSKSFFDRPADAKMRLVKHGKAYGYEPVGAQALDTDSPPDYKESYNISAPGLPGSPDHLDNQWPDDMPEFRRVLEAYHAEVRRVAFHISRLIAKSLDMPFEYFDRNFDHQRASLRLLKYPPLPQDARHNQLGAGAHTDFGWITVVAQDMNGGLEVETASGDWIKVDPVPGAFVVNLGDLVPEWTNGLYHSSLHRVMNKRPDKDRYSVVLFYNPRYETVVETVPTCLAPGEKPRPSFVSGEHRQQRAAAAKRSVAY